MPEKLPPHSIETEEALLGALLVEPTTIEKIVEILSPGDFYSERNSIVYQACLNVEKVDQISVGRDLTEKGKVEAAGGIAYLAYLVSVCGSPFDAEFYAEDIKRLSVLRNLIDTGRKIEELGYIPTININDTIDKARTLLDAIKPSRSKYLELSNLRIIKSKPPHYILTVNGTDLSITIGELQQWGRFRTKVLSELDFLPLKPKNWDGVINRLLEQAQKMEAPSDTSAEVEVKLSTKRWFEQRGEGTEYSDIQSGCYAVLPYRGKETNFESKDYWAFQPTPLLRWLKRDLQRTITRDTLWSMMYDWGAVKWQWRIGKENSLPVKLWALPPSFATEAEFAVEREEEQEEMLLEEGEEEELPDF